MELGEFAQPLGAYAKIQLDRCSVLNIHKDFAQRLISVRKRVGTGCTFRKAICRKIPT